MCRKVFKALTPKTVKVLIAKRMQAGLERVQVMEKETAWLRTHGSPQRVLNLPEHASLQEIKNRYTDMILDTHPDTSTGTQNRLEDHRKEVEAKAGVVANTHTKGASSNAVQKAPKPEPPSFDLVRQAYHMVINPNSTYHLNGSNPELLAEVQLYTGKTTLTTPATKIAIGSYLLGAVGATIGVVFGLYMMWEGLLQLYDPEFYKKMVAKEKDEAARRAAGEEVNTDPKRLAPKKLKQILFPGQFIHDDPEAPSQDGEDPIPTS